MRRHSLVIVFVALSLCVAAAQTRLPSRAEVDRVLRGVDPETLKTEPRLKPGMSPEEKAYALSDIDRGLREMEMETKGQPGVPESVHLGVRIWEALTPAERQKLLSGIRPSQPKAEIIPTWAVAAVALAALVYQVGKDYSWWGRKQPQPKYLESQPLSDKQLDYLKQLRKPPAKDGDDPGNGGSPPRFFDDRVLNY